MLATLGTGPAGDLGASTHVVQPTQPRHGPGRLAEDRSATLGRTSDSKTLWRRLADAAPHAGATEPDGHVRSDLTPLGPVGQTIRRTPSELHPQAISPLEELKAKQHQIWSNGDYGKIAWVTVPLAERLVDAVDLRPGGSVLDVACGTGHVAIEAARTFCDVTGIDYVAELVETARRRAAAEGLPIAFEVADAEALPVRGRVVRLRASPRSASCSPPTTTAPPPSSSASASPAARIGLASWTAEGFIGRLLKTVSAHVAAAPRRRCRRPGGATRMSSASSSATTSPTSRPDTHVVTQRSPPAEAFADFMLTYYGPTYTAAQKLDATGPVRVPRTTSVALAHDANQATDGTFVTDWEYRVVTATKEA